jgi:serine protease
MNIYRLLIITVVFGFLYSNVSQNILFALKKHDNSLQFSAQYKLTQNSNYELQKIFDEFNIKTVEPWLKSAQKDECFKEICLDKIIRIKEYSGEISYLKNRLELLPEILFVEPEAINKPYYTPNDQQYNQQWFLPQVKADEAWDLWYPELGISPGDPSVLLASVDTGVDWDHPDLRNSLWNNLGEDANGNGVTIIQQGNTWILDPGDDNNIDDDGNGFIDDLIGWDVSGVEGLPDNNPTPKPGVSTGGTWAHGTHVAGLLNATTDNITGVSSVGFNCKIMSVKSSEEENNPDVYITDGYDGILYAAKAGFYSVGGTIINCSWGSTQFSTSGQAVIDIAYENFNAVVVAAGGNGVEDGWGEEYTAHYPSSFNHVIAVAPLGTGDSWNNWATYHETIDISSPGESIRSTKIGTGYVNWMGSSMASPIVASSIGLLKAFHPSWKNEQLEMMIIETADPIIYELNSASYLTDRLGKGRVDVYNALITPLLPKLTFVDVDLFMLEGDDNLIHQGELAQVGVIIWNEDDWGDAIDINIEISTNNQNITFENSTSFISQIQSGAVDINYADPFLIQFENNVIPGEVEFILTINSNYSNNSNYFVESTFTLNVLETPLILGDLNYDSIINVTDVIILVNIIIGGFTEDWLETGADANQNGNIDVADIITIVGIILGE